MIDAYGIIITVGCRHYYNCRVVICLICAFDSAETSRQKQSMLCTADFADDEAANSNHGHNVVGITLFRFPCNYCTT